MQPLIMLAIVGVAVAALSAGSLTNVIDLAVQDFGVGDATIDSPVSHASIDFNIGQTRSNGVIYNIVDLCTIYADRDLADGTNVFCKLTNDVGNVIAEGHKVISAVNSHNAITVPITNLAGDFSNNVKNVHDVLLVIQAP